MLEELKLVLEVVQNVSDGAMWIAIMWIAKGYLSLLLGYGFGFLIIYYSYKFGVRAFTTYADASKVAKMLGYDFCYTSGKKRTIEKIQDLLTFYKRYKGEVDKL
jgi:hypothetical protein